MEQMAHKGGTIVPFPLSRRVAHVRDVAFVLLRRQGPAADRFWKTTVRGLRGQLQASGILDEADIDRQIEAFSGAVFDLIGSTRRSDNGGGCA